MIKEQIANNPKRSGVPHDSPQGKDEAGLQRGRPQKRRLLAHKLGVIDEEYASKTGDPAAVIGRRISVDQDEFKELILNLRQLAAALAVALAR